MTQFQSNAVNERAAIGGNSPPSQKSFVDETKDALSAWVSDHPTVCSEDEAREGKLLVDRAVSALADLEQERDGKVRPLNQQVKAINEEYRKPRDELNLVLGLLKDRLQAFLRAEEDRRRRVAEAAAKEAARAAAVARAAEQAKLEAAAEAIQGVIVDVGGAGLDAARAEQEAQRLARAAAIAERDAAKVKIGGGFRKGLAERTVEVLIVDDALSAIICMGITDQIQEAILTSARAYRKATGNLPEGIISRKERTL